MKLYLKTFALVVGPGVFLTLCWTLPFAWLEMLSHPFNGWTFTDATDFLFAALIPVTLLALAGRHHLRPHPAAWVCFARVAALLLAVLAPLALLAVLYLLSWRVEEVKGHWPVPIIDDPHHLVWDDPRCRPLCTVYAFACSFAGWGLWTLGGLALHLRSHLSRRDKGWLLAVFLVSWLVFVTVGDRYVWWLD